MQEQITNSLEKLASFAHSNLSTNGDKQVIENKKFKLVITTNEKWIGVEFTAFGISGADLFYFTDTDNYNVSKKENEWFLNEIAADIQLLIKSLVNNSLLVGTFKNRPAMIIPKTSGFIRVVKSRLSGYTSRDFQKLEDAKFDGNFIALIVSEE